VVGEICDLAVHEYQEQTLRVSKCGRSESMLQGFFEGLPVDLRGQVYLEVSV
jgi:hypothetical protein